MKTFSSSSESSENGSSRKTLLIGILVVACIGLGTLAVVGTENAGFHLGRANNILRRWRCPEGGYPSGPGRNGDCICSMCPPGYTCAGGFNPKRPCKSGTYQNRKGQNSCRPSPRGHHVPKSGASRPTVCAKGTYQNQIGQSRCLPCALGNMCPRPKMVTPLPCGLGTYQNRRGQRLCIAAYPGTYVNKRGEVNPTKCHYGTYQNLRGQRNCKKAAPGYKVPRRGSPKQILCPPNEYQQCGGQITCMPCNPGFSSKTGSTKCTQNN